METRNENLWRTASGDQGGFVGFLFNGTEYTMDRGMRFRLAPKGNINAIRSMLGEAIGLIKAA